MVLHRTEMNDTTLENEDLRLQACFTDYITEFLRRGNNLTSLDKGHIFECCNGTFPYNCSVPTALFPKVEAQMEDGTFFKFMIEGVILTFISTFGFIGNTMSVIVLTRTASGSTGGLSSGASFSNLLRGLAAFDALFLLAAILSFGLPVLSTWYINNVFLGGVCIMRFLFGLIHTFRIGSVYMTLSVTFERFHAIIFPLRHFSMKKFLIPVSVGMAVLYNIPKYFELKIEDNKIQETELRQNPIYVNLYVVWSKIIFIEIIPYFAILIMNIFIIVKITKSTRFRRKFQRQYPDQETTAAGPMTETTALCNGRPVGKAGSAHANRNEGCKLIQSRSSSVDNHVNDKLENNMGSCTQTRIAITKRVEKEAASPREEKPFLPVPKHPSIEVESASEDEPNRSDIHVNDKVQSKGTEHENMTKEIFDAAACNHKLSDISENKNRYLPKASISSTSNFLDITEDSTPPSRSSFSKGFKRSASQPDAKLNKSGKKNRVQKKHFLRKQQEEHSLGIILIIMSILFIICQSLKIVPDMYEIIVCKPSDKCEFPPIIKNLTMISHLLVCINSAANFLIYYCAGGKFREAWLETYGFWWCRCSMKNLKKMVTIPFQRRNDLSTRRRSSHDASGGDVLSQVVRLSPNRSVQTIRLSPMGKQPQSMASQNKTNSQNTNFELDSHAHPSVESSFITKIEKENESHLNKLTYSEV